MTELGAKWRWSVSQEIGTSCVCIKLQGREGIWQGGQRFCCRPWGSDLLWVLWHFWFRLHSKALCLSEFQSLCWGDCGEARGLCSDFQWGDLCSDVFDWDLKGCLNSPQVRSVLVVLIQQCLSLKASGHRTFFCGGVQMLKFTFWILNHGERLIGHLVQNLLNAENQELEHLCQTFWPPEISIFIIIGLCNWALPPFRQCSFSPGIILQGTSQLPNCKVKPQQKWRCWKGSHTS